MGVITASRYFFYAVCCILIANAQKVAAVQRLVEGPSTTEVNLDAASVTLKCVVENRSGDVFWSFPGKQFADITDRSLPSYPRHRIVGDAALGEYNLEISDVQLGDDGYYECQVTPGSTGPDLRSAPATLSVRRPPVSVTVSDGPQKTVHVAQPTNLTCTAIGANPPVSITWLKDGTPVASTHAPSSPSSDPSGKLWDTESILTVTPEVADRGATYQCQAINSAIMEPMVDSVILDVLLHSNCMAEGPLPRSKYPLPQLPLFRPLEKLWDRESILTVTSEVADQWATYQCQAINSAIMEPMVESVILDVLHPPVIHMETIPGELREELAAVIRCVVDANPIGVLYQWAKNGEPITGETNEFELELEKNDHQAVYTCTAVNSEGTTEGSITLDVKYGPRFVDIPGETSVDESELAQLQCSADGNPPATVKWSRIGSRATLSTMETLQFDSVQESDIGVYVCEATVDGFEPILSYGQVDINSIPVIKYSEIQQARSGSSARLECLTESKPIPERIVWSWDEVMLDQGTFDRFTVTKEKRETGYVGILTIQKVHHSDFREYNCTMINDKGASEAIIALEPKGLDLLFFIIIFVITLALVIFVTSIIFMLYCKRRLQKSSRSSASTEEESSEEEVKKNKVEIIRKLSDIHLSDEERRKLAALSEPPRYAEPFIPGRRDSFEDPTYRRLSVGSHQTPPYGEDPVDRRYSTRSSHDYMDAVDGSFRGPRLSGVPDRDPRYEGSLDEPSPPAHRGSHYDGSPEEPPSRIPDRDSQYGGGTLRREPARLSGISAGRDPRRDSGRTDPAPRATGEQYPRRSSDTRGFGYFAEPPVREPGETASLVRRDNPHRRSDLSVNSRNKLATNV